MSQKVFIDTNIWVYLYDRHDLAQHRIAEKLIFDQLQDADPVISQQVIHEFSSVMLTKQGLPPDAVAEIINQVLRPKLDHAADADYCLRALELLKHASLSFYDALVVQAALDLKCAKLYTEDMQDGQVFGKLTIVNPFAAKSK